ncbi:tRNA(fMet)-specific endonuclease VapC [bacterium HR16]|nr:tRNA(fMet)-specific endonuclease VapC [bacterium HR16]
MLLDTSGLVCYFDRSDYRHQEAEQIFRSAASKVVHSYILAEFIPLCRSRRLDVGKALAFARELLESEDVLVIWVDEPIHRAALTLLEARPDKTYSLCDAVSFVIMRLLGITEALTTDRHFEQEGFTRLLEP